LDKNSKQKAKRKKKEEGLYLAQRLRQMVDQPGIWLKKKLRGKVQKTSQNKGGMYGRH